MDLIRVIIPYYKKKKYIKSTISSILNQTYQKFEIIIIYDDSNKSDLAYLKKITRKNKKIKLVINNHNIGAGLSRNRGIYLSKGKYICFIDADDLWKKNKLKLQIEFMKKNNYLISHTSYYIFNEKNKNTQFREAKDYLSFERLLRSCDIGLSTVMIKKNLFKKNLKFSKTKTKEDFVLWLKISKSAIPIYALKKPLTKWRSLNDSLSSSTFQKIRDGYGVYKNYLNFGYMKSLYFLFLLSLNFLIKSYKSKINV